MSEAYERAKKIYSVLKTGVIKLGPNDYMRGDVSANRYGETFRIKYKIVNPFFDFASDTLGNERMPVVKLMGWIRFFNADDNDTPLSSNDPKWRGLLSVVATRVNFNFKKINIISHLIMDMHVSHIPSKHAKNEHGEFNTINSPTGYDDVTTQQKINENDSLDDIAPFDIEKLFDKAKKVFQVLKVGFIEIKQNEFENAVAGTYKYELVKPIFDIIYDSYSGKTYKPFLKCWIKIHGLLLPLQNGTANRVKGKVEENFYKFKIICDINKNMSSNHHYSKFARKESGEKFDFNLTNGHGNYNSMD